MKTLTQTFDDWNVIKKTTNTNDFKIVISKSKDLISPT